MSDLNKFSNLRTLRALAREATLEQLEALLEKVQTFVTE